MIICKACELKQEPTPKCRGCGVGLFFLGTLPSGINNEHPKVLRMLPFIFVPEDLNEKKA